MRCQGVTSLYRVTWGGRHISRRPWEGPKRWGGRPRQKSEEEWDIVRSWVVCGPDGPIGEAAPSSGKFSLGSSCKSKQKRH